MSTDSGRQAGELTDVEITPAMVEVGVLALCDYDPNEEEASAAVARIFLAMRGANERGESISELVREVDQKKMDEVLKRMLHTPPKPHKPPRAAAKKIGDEGSPKR